MTMYLSNLLIDVGANPDRPRPGRLWLRNVYRVHQRLCMAFPDKRRKEDDPQFLKPFAEEDFPETIAAKDEAATGDVHQPRSGQNGFLYRIDLRLQDPRDKDQSAGGPPVILVLSAKEPDWNYAFQNAPLLSAPPKTKVFTFKPAAGEQYHFRLKANTVRKVGHGPLNGNRVSVGRDPAALTDWLWRKGEAHGFEPLFEPKENGWDPRWRLESGMLRAWREKGEKEREAMSFAFGLFDGVLRVKDPGRLVDAVQSGIGHGKAFGFGLLSLARISS